MQETTEPMMQRITNMNINLLNMLTTIFTNLLNNNRTRVASMAMVKKLNCWGADLTNPQQADLPGRLPALQEPPGAVHHA